MKIELKNTTGKAVGSIDLDDSVFGADIHEHLLWEVVKWQLAKRRSGTAPERTAAVSSRMVRSLAVVSPIDCSARGDSAPTRIGVMEPAHRSRSRR
mgnify:CR=1 FL=1